MLAMSAEFIGTKRSAMSSTVSEKPASSVLLTSAVDRDSVYLFIYLFPLSSVTGTYICVSHKLLPKEKNYLGPKVRVKQTAEQKLNHLGP